MFRWTLQIFVMSFDVVFIAAAVFILAESWKNPLAWGLVLWGTWVWVRQGAFMAWIPSNIRKFMRNARKQGL